MSDARRRRRLWAIFTQPPPPPELWLMTATYPAGHATVLSVQPNGKPEARPPGTEGPYELAVGQADRLVYAPLGTQGAVFLVPYCAAVPNG